LTTVTIGGTAVVALSGAVTGFYIVNPATAADQGVTVEPLFVDPVNTATVVGNGTNSSIAAGNSYSGVPSSSATISVNAATAGHKFTCVRW
jgi:hypothetical protein